MQQYVSILKSLLSRFIVALIKMLTVQKFLRQSEDWSTTQQFLGILTLQTLL